MVLLYPLALILYWESSSLIPQTNMPCFCQIAIKQFIHHPFILLGFNLSALDRQTKTCLAHTTAPHSPPPGWHRPDMRRYILFMYWIKIPFPPTPGQELPSLIDNPFGQRTIDVLQAWEKGGRERERSGRWRLEGKASKRGMQQRFIAQDNKHTISRKQPIWILFALN